MTQLCRENNQYSPVPWKTNLLKKMRGKQSRRNHPNNINDALYPKVEYGMVNSA
jgi:hypothetical protein